jgi:hypothetical protein
VSLRGVAASLRRRGRSLRHSLFGHRWFAIGWGEVRCRDCHVWGTQNVNHTRIRLHREG